MICPVDTGVVSSNPTQLHTFLEITYSPPSADSRKAFVSMCTEYWLKLAQEKSVIRWIGV